MSAPSAYAPPASTGETVSRSSSSTSAATSWASSVGPPSAWMRCRPRSCSAAIVGAQVDVVVTGDDHVGDLGDPAPSVAVGRLRGDDDRALERLGVERCGQVERERAADHHDHGGVGLPGGASTLDEVRLGLRRPVALGAHGAGAGEHGVGQPAQAPEHPTVGIAGDRRPTGRRANGAAPSTVLTMLARSHGVGAGQPGQAYAASRSSSLRSLADVGQEHAHAVDPGMSR